MAHRSGSNGAGFVLAETAYSDATTASITYRIAFWPQQFLLAGNDIRHLFHDNEVTSRDNDSEPSTNARATAVRFMPELAS